LKEVISCDTVTFKNKARLFRQFNCDSSWLVFESESGQKKTLYSIEKDFIEFTERLGYQYTSEFSTTFLIKNRVVSGCCYPAEFLLFNKENGSLIKDFGSILQFTTDLNKNFVVFFDQTLDAINIYNIESGSQFKVLLPNNRLDYTMRNSSELYPEALVENIEIIDAAVSIEYKYHTKGRKKVWLKDKIYIDLRDRL
jgi:hypothetical protein